MNSLPCIPSRISPAGFLFFSRDAHIERGVDIVGANCTVGPQRMFSIIRSMHKDGVILFAQPATGIPTLLDGRSIYHTTPEYLGILPLRGTKDAEFLHNEVPGMSIPDEIRDKLKRAGDRGPQAGLEISKSFLKEAKHLVSGAYMMPPFQKYQIVDELLEVVRRG